MNPVSDTFEMSLLSCFSSSPGLPMTVDLVVSALDSPSASTFSEQPWYQNVVAWTKSNDVKAQVLALDPPPQGPGMSAR